RSLGSVDPAFEIVGTRDLNGDGRADILFRRKSDGSTSAFLMNGFQLVSAQAIGVVDPAFAVVGLGDINGDGRADLVFPRARDGMLAALLRKGGQALAPQFLAPGGATIGYGQPPLVVSQAPTQ